MYKLYVRRNATESWSAWTQTDDLNILVKNAITVDGLGWKWRVCAAYAPTN